MLAILAPGQGVQSPGFLRPWLTHAPYAERLGDLLRGVPGLDTGLDTELDTASVLDDTALLQPLLVAAGLAAAALLPVPSRARLVVAGHSVGELTAVALAGTLEPRAAVDLAATRGRAMAAAAAATPGAMVAVVGPPTPLESVASTWTGRGLTLANRNGTHQVVLAGPDEAAQALLDAQPAGVRTVRLAVAGAFHTQLMRPAVGAVQEAVGALSPAEATWPVVSCVDGGARQDGHDVLGQLPEQVVSCVRWDLCQRTLRAMGVTGLLELPPASTLTALARRDLPGVERYALDSPDGLPGAGELVRRHA